MLSYIDQLFSSFKKKELTNDLDSDAHNTSPTKHQNEKILTKNLTQTTILDGEKPAPNVGTKKQKQTANSTSYTNKNVQQTNNILTSKSFKSSKISTFTQDWRFLEGNNNIRKEHMRVIDDVDKTDDDDRCDLKDSACIPELRVDSEVCSEVDDVSWDTSRRSSATSTGSEVSNGALTKYNYQTSESNFHLSKDETDTDLDKTSETTGSNKFKENLVIRSLFIHASNATMPVGAGSYSEYLDSGDESDRFFDCEDHNLSNLCQQPDFYSVDKYLEHNSDNRESFSENEANTLDCSTPCRTSPSSLLSSSSNNTNKAAGGRKTKTQRQPSADCSVSVSPATRQHNSVATDTSVLRNCYHPTAIEIDSSIFTIPFSPSSHSSAMPSSSTCSSISANSYSSSYKVLTFDQFRKLEKLMNSDIEIHGQGNFPNIKVALKDFVVSFKLKLQAENIPLDSVRLNGGAASHVIGMRQMIDDIGYNDLDLIFGLSSDDEQVFENVRQLLYSTLRTLLPSEGVDPNSLKLSDSAIDDGYVQKMVKVCNANDCWSLISLYNNDGENVEVKFVHRMKRPYEFSVDSFQIELDSFLSYYEVENENVKFTKEFFPTVMAESKYGKFDEALFHLNNKLVATLKPEEIRGGGLLKYCNLLLNGYNIADSDIKNLERYMCSRFFIDFPDSGSQQNKLQGYMRTHLRKAPRKAAVANTCKTNCSSVEVTNGNESNAMCENKENLQIPSSNTKEKCDDGSLEQHRINFLLICRKIIDESTVCLMNIERACTLNLLDSLIADLLRTYLSKNEAAKLVLDHTESGYFSENSSMSNSVSSPNNFSRSSSPGISMNGNGLSSASRSSSPAAVYGIASSRISPLDLSALSGNFLHPALASSGLHFGSPQFFHAFTNVNGLSLINSSYLSQRGLDPSSLTVNNQHGNHGGNQSNRHYQDNQYHHHNQASHSHQGKSHHHNHNGGSSRNNRGGYYNKQAMSNGMHNYHQHGNHHGYYQHSANNSGQMSGTHHYTVSGGAGGHHHYNGANGNNNVTQSNGNSNGNAVLSGPGSYYSGHHSYHQTASQSYNNNGAHPSGNSHRNGNNNHYHHNTSYYHTNGYPSHYNHQNYQYEIPPQYLNSPHNQRMAMVNTSEMVSDCYGTEFTTASSCNENPEMVSTMPPIVGDTSSADMGEQQIETFDANSIQNSQSIGGLSECQFEENNNENIVQGSESSSSSVSTCQTNQISTTCHDQSTPVILTAY